jgi:hypothetical protein
MSKRSCRARFLEFRGETMIIRRCFWLCGIAAFGLGISNVALSGEPVLYTPPNPYVEALDHPANVATPGHETPPGGVDAELISSSSPNLVAAASAPISSPVAVSTPIVLERLTESTWYYRLDCYNWTEDLGGGEKVKEYGPMSTVGYMHRNGQERFRLEVFGGTVAYDGYTQSESGGVYVSEHFHTSNGTNYIGMRAEYDFLIEPDCWKNARLVLGVGTRFWVRDLQDTALEDVYVRGYPETWWTFYPYIGVETKTSDPSTLHFFGSARVGVTPITYQYVGLFDSYYESSGTILYPKCGMTAQAEIGISCRRVTLSAYTELMSWSQSNVVRDIYQPDSMMFTIGGRCSFTF